MILALTIAAFAAAAAFWLARPLLRRGAVELAESEQALSIYRDQRDEVARDRAAGLISEASAEEAAREIERRALRAAGALDASVTVTRRHAPLAAGLALLVAAFAAAVYLGLGAPGAPDMPLAARQAELERRLAEIEAAKPRPPADEDFQTAWFEARRAAADGDYARAAEAYRRAAAKSNDAPAVVSAYAEAMTLANGNKVPPAARLVFEQVLARDPAEPRARYYVALARAQAQDFEGALADWRALLADSGPDAPWRPLVIRDIAAMARFLEVDPASVLPSEDVLADDVAASSSAAGPMSDAAPAPRGPNAAQVAAAAGLSPAEQDDMARGMVAGLARRLAEDPSDVSGWVMLMRSYAALGEVEAAQGTVARAAAAFAEGSEERRAVRIAAARLGLD